MTELANIIKESTTEPTKRFASLIEKRSKSLGSVGLAVVYTVGHIVIAITCAAFIFDAPLNNNPLPWTEHWLSSKGLQVAPQETEVESYVIGGITQDVEENTFKGFQL